MHRLNDLKFTGTLSFSALFTSRLKEGKIRLNHRLDQVFLIGKNREAGAVLSSLIIKSHNNHAFNSQIQKKLLVAKRRFGMTSGNISYLKHQITPPNVILK